MWRVVLLTQIESLLGDEVTSDVIVSVIDDKENGVFEIGKFLCHSAILNGKRDVSKLDVPANVLFCSSELTIILQ